MEYAQQFAQRLRQAMDSKATTMYRLAKELGVHQTTIKNWLDGKGGPNLGQVQQIAQILDTDVVYLISGQTSAELEHGILIQAEEEARTELEKLQFESNNRSFNERVSLNSAIIQIIKRLKQFNQIGHEKAVERIEELTEIPRYRRQDHLEAPPAPAGDTDTPTPENAPEGPKKGAEMEL